MRFLTLVVVWFTLLVICPPLAIVLLVLLPVIYLVLLPFRLAFMVIEAVFALLRAVLFLPARAMRAV